MAPRKKMTGRDVPAGRQETTDDRRHAEDRADTGARIRANQKHVAVTGKVMPQGGRHRPENAAGTAQQRAEEKKPRGKRRG